MFLIQLTTRRIYLFKTFSDEFSELDEPSTQRTTAITVYWNATVTNQMANSNIIGTKNKSEHPDVCYLATYDEISQIVRVMAEIVIVIWSTIYLGIAAREATFLPTKLFFQCMALCPSRVAFLFACALIQVMVILRLSCQSQFEDQVANLVIFLIPLHFLFFCRGIKATGPFVTMIYRMIANDLLRFGLIYLIFVLGFSQSYYIIFKSYIDPNPKLTYENNPIKTPMDSVLENFQLSLGSNLGYLWKKYKHTDYNQAAKLQCCIFLMVIFVMLINLLIAMMSDTYTRIAEIKNEWIRQWARVVLLLERGIPSDERLIEQDNYSERMVTGEKALILKQTLSIEELEEIRHITQMKKTHRQSIRKRKELFGYESNSTIGLNLTSYC